jgi:hypothetical protein
MRRRYERPRSVRPLLQVRAPLYIMYAPFIHYVLRFIPVYIMYVPFIHYVCLIYTLYIMYVSFIHYVCLIYTLCIYFRDKTKFFKDVVFFLGSRGVGKHTRGGGCRNPNPKGRALIAVDDYIEFSFPGVVSEEDAMARDIQPTRVDFEATDKDEEGRFRAQW